MIILGLMFSAAGMTVFIWGMRTSLTGSGDGSVVSRVSRDSSHWLGSGFEFLQGLRENFLVQGPLSVLRLISASVPPTCYRGNSHVKLQVILPVLCRSLVARLQLNTNAPYVDGFAAWSDMVHGCMVYAEGGETAVVSRGTSHISIVSQWHHFGE